ncbi:MAG: hypothetical protein Q9183_007317, partial [Haloplaca sp. 2 TL-2023]
NLNTDEPPSSRHYNLSQKAVRLSHETPFQAFDIYSQRVLSHALYTLNPTPREDRMMHAFRLGQKPTAISLTSEDCSLLNRRRDILDEGYKFKTRWTKPMLLEFQELDKQKITDRAILRSLKENFDKPDMLLEEIWQERAFLKLGPRNSAFWSFEMQKMLQDLSQQGMDAQAITVELNMMYGYPNKWTETYRKMQQMTLDG